MNGRILHLNRRYVVDRICSKLSILYNLISEAELHGPDLKVLPKFCTGKLHESDICNALGIAAFLWVYHLSLHHEYESHFTQTNIDIEIERKNNKEFTKFNDVSTFINICG